VPQEKGKDELWHHALEKYLGAVLIRRECWVKNWILANTIDIDGIGDVQNLGPEATAQLARMKQRLTLCSCKCDVCCLRWVEEKSHSGDHSCKGSHKCTQSCSFCIADKSIINPGTKSQQHHLQGP
jgi:hypothetical protein